MSIFFSFFPAMAGKNTIVNSSDKNRSSSSDKAIILCFHDVDGKGEYSIRKEELREIFTHLQKNFEVMSLRTWYEKNLQKEGFKRTPLILTFDDGYPSVFKTVVPLLEEFNYGATLFIYTDRYPDYSNFFEKLGRLPDSIEVGSHSFSHPNMSSVRNQDLTRFYQEVFLSKKKLEFLTGKNIISWAWPYGAYTPELVDLGRKAGYKIQVSTDYNLVGFEDANEILSRFTIMNPDPVGQALKIVQKTQPH